VGGATAELRHIHLPLIQNIFENDGERSIGSATIALLEPMAAK
jgi:hypothetical protein